MITVSSFRCYMQNEHVKYALTDNRPQSLENFYEQTNKFIQEKQIKRAMRGTFQRDDRQLRNREEVCNSQGLPTQTLHAQGDRQQSKPKAIHPGLIIDLSLRIQEGISPRACLKSISP